MKKFITSLFALMSMVAITHQVVAADLVFNVTVPAGTFECYVVGNFSNWDVENAYKMTKDGDNHYTITIPEADLNQEAITNDGAILYKYVSGPDWAYVETTEPYTGLNNRTYDPSQPGREDVVTSWAAIYNPNVEPVPMDVTIMAQVPKEVIVLYIAGTFNDWDPAATEMEFVEETDEGKIFVVTFHTDDANKLRFKFCAGPGWEYEQTIGDISYPDPTEDTATFIIEAFKDYYHPASITNPTANFEIYSQDQKLVVKSSNVISKVELFDISGRRVQSAQNVGTSFISQKLNKGIYIVRVDNVSTKVTVQ
ncbi:MAG: T9SS type A sorting domain-containing protein [Paludibacteraceae bacterium]|nr:T9SS type A sorting domain-containing protein [Paludibacteraceae bacterium]